MREIISLNGLWDWRVPGGPVQKRHVPSCYFCVGDAHYSRAFALPEIARKRVILHFEGVHYTGAVTVNGVFMGDMLPYVFYDFDITACARPGENTVEVLVKDINAAFGPTNGWEDYGGISRDVWLEIADLVGIADTQWITTLKDNFNDAAATLNLWLFNQTSEQASANITAKLSYHGRVIAESACEALIPANAAGSSTTNGRTPKSKKPNCSLSFSLEGVHLWDTANPHLYQLSIELASGNMNDGKGLDVGFREFIVKGASFYLNGVKTFLKGVARHDMWGDGQGFSLSRSQVEQDLDLVKGTGANFIRLVHYPHSRYTIEYAAKIGLMVSEEPGLWWHRMADPFVKKCALEIMRRTVLRDRSNPAVVAWLFFNECPLGGAMDYLKRGHAMCRSLDPTRLLSGASCDKDRKNKRVFDKVGMDFYTQHPYCFEGEKMGKAAKIQRGKPLVFTEWGGWYIHYNANLIKLFQSIITPLAHAPENEPHINGMCWWQWQDIWQFSRALPGCEDGLLSDGLVDRNRNRKPAYDMMIEFFNLVDKKPEPLFELEEYPEAVSEMEEALTPLDLSMFYGAENDKLWEGIRSKFRMKRFWKTPIHKEHMGIHIGRKLTSLAGLPCEIPEGRPIILRGKRAKVDIPVGRQVDHVYIFGAVTYFDGYPMRGKFNESAAEITLAYEDGTVRRVPLRHGMELASASLIGRDSRVNAMAVCAPRVAKITQNHDWECYAVNLLALPADGEKILKRMTINAIDKAFAPVIYAISIG